MQSKDLRPPETSAEPYGKRKRSESGSVYGWESGGKVGGRETGSKGPWKRQENHLGAPQFTLSGTSLWMIFSPYC